jgi:hypothetical protein
MLCKFEISKFRAKPSQVYVQVRKNLSDLTAQSGLFLAAASRCGRSIVIRLAKLLQAFIFAAAPSAARIAASAALSARDTAASAICVSYWHDYVPKL